MTEQQDTERTNKYSEETNKGIDNLHDEFNIRDFLDTSSMSESEIDRCEFWVSANRIVRESGKFNFQGERIPVNSEWNLDLMETWLQNYEDKNLIDYLRFGWPLNVVNTEIDEEIPRNQKGARSNPEQVREYLRKELAAGSIIRPFNRNPFGKKARFSPLDTRPKKGTEELRIILNLSHPYEGHSVNNSIWTDWYAETDDMVLRYPSVDDLAKIIRRKGRKARIFIRDLSKAYRQLWMCPSSIHLLGYQFEEKFYFDVTLSMGSRSVAYCCQRTTNAITHIFQNHGYDDVNYLYDLCATEEDKKADKAYDCLGWILVSIGIREAAHKSIPPAYIAVFLGILFNTITMTMQITPDRLMEIKQLLQTWLRKKSATLKDMQSLLGKLNFAASTVRSGRIFVSRLINSLKDFPKNSHRKIDKEMRKDNEWWIQFMESFDGITVMPLINWDAPDTVFSSDANLKSGGRWSSGEAFKTDFPAWLLQRKDVHINELELITFIVALKLWKEKIQDRNVLAYCDNAVSVEVVNSGKAKNRFTQACLREICYITARHNAVLKLIHLSSECNRISDCLSRWSDPRKREEFA